MLIIEHCDSDELKLAAALCFAESMAAQEPFHIYAQIHPTSIELFVVPDTFEKFTGVPRILESFVSIGAMQLGSIFDITPNPQTGSVLLTIK